MKVKFVYEFEFDEEGYDPEVVDIEGLAKESAISTMFDDLEDGSITEDDFEIVRELDIDVTGVLRRFMERLNDADKKLGIPTEEKKREKIADLYKRLVSYRDEGGEYVYIDTVIGYLGEFLDD